MPYDARMDDDDDDDDDVDADADDYDGANDVRTTRDVKPSHDDAFMTSSSSRHADWTTSRRQRSSLAVDRAASTSSPCSTDTRTPSSTPSDCHASPSVVDVTPSPH